jgi:hypothetical protein
VNRQRPVSRVGASASHHFHSAGATNISGVTPTSLPRRIELFLSLEVEREQRLGVRFGRRVITTGSELEV